MDIVTSWAHAGVKVAIPHSSQSPIMEKDCTNTYQVLPPFMPTNLLLPHFFPTFCIVTLAAATYDTRNIQTSIKLKKSSLCTRLYLQFHTIRFALATIVTVITVTVSQSLAHCHPYGYITRYCHISHYCHSNHICHSSHCHPYCYVNHYCHNNATVVILSLFSIITIIYMKLHNIDLYDSI